MKFLKTKVLAVVILGASLHTYGDTFNIVKKSEITLPKPAFMSWGLTDKTKQTSSILVSSFKPFGHDAVFEITNPKEILNGHGAKINTLTTGITWPNEVKALDSSQFGLPGLLVSSGFLFPTKSTGAISFLNLQDNKITQLTKNKRGYFYHRAIFADISNTSRMDILTARSHIPLVGKPDGELVWLKRPADPLQGHWQEVVLAKGPDIHFRVFQDSITKGLMIVTAEFSRKLLGLYWIEKDGEVKSRVLDNTLGSPFDLDFFDLNHDGKLDLLVTNHQHDASSGVFAYEVPMDVKTAPWPRHVLLSGITTLQKGFNQASPGAAKAFYPAVNQKDHKPWILVSGDGSQRVHLLTPLSETPSDWGYKEDIILDTKSTVGEPLIGDIDGDGLADIIVPAYDSDKIYFLSVTL